MHLSRWGFPVTRIRYGRIRQDTAGYGRLRQDTAGYGRIRQDTAGYGRIRQDMAGYRRIRRIRQDTAGYVRIRQIRQDTAGYGRIRQDTAGYAYYRNTDVLGKPQCTLLASAFNCATEPPQAYGASMQCYEHPRCGILCTIASVFGELWLAMNALPVVRPLWCSAFGGGPPCLKTKKYLLKQCEKHGIPLKTLQSAPK